MSEENIENKEIEELQAEKEKEKRKRYPLFDILENREDIGKISIATCNYLNEIIPDFSMPEELWTIIPRVVIELVQSIYNTLANKKSADGTVVMQLSDLFQIGIESGKTIDAAKAGTLNPIITTLPKMDYDNKNPSNNKLTNDIPEIGDNDDMELICKEVQNVMKARYGVKISKYKQIYQIAIGFFRVARDYLIKKKKEIETAINKNKELEESERNDDILSDFYDSQIQIKLGGTIIVSIEAYGEVNKTLYHISVLPGRTFKCDYAKNDEQTEVV